ncbi:LysM peptidoglycan-binding domain-containing protein [Niallia taxi]
MAAGDTLSAISQRYGVSVSAIAKANNIQNINQIYAGQRLIIPES